MSDHRYIVELESAQRTRNLFSKQKGSSPAAKLGLRYERRVLRELTQLCNRGYFLDLEHTPWFSFEDKYGPGTCSPDFLMFLDKGIVIIETKLTWVPNALSKLEELYCPVVSCAFNAPVRPLVICRSVTPQAPQPKLTLREAILADSQLMLYAMNGPMLW